MTTHNLDQVLPATTLAAWPKVVQALPGGGYLAGGTAVAVHLGHRQSRDLDVFVDGTFDPEEVRDALSDLGSLSVSLQTDDTLNGWLDGARVQFLAAPGRRNIDEPKQVQGMPVAGIRDLMADKLKVVGDRGELRDYFDLMVIEEATPHRAEHGIAYYRHRYDVGPDHITISHIVRALGHFADVADDPALPVPREEIEAYWLRRQPAVSDAIGSALVSHGAAPGGPDLDDAGPPAGVCGAQTRRGRPCQNPRGSCPHH